MQIVSATLISSTVYALQAELCDSNKDRKITRLAEVGENKNDPGWDHLPPFFGTRRYCSQRVQCAKGPNYAWPIFYFTYYQGLVPRFTTVFFFQVGSVKSMQSTMNCHQLLLSSNFVWRLRQKTKAELANGGLQSACKIKPKYRYEEVRRPGSVIWKEFFLSKTSMLRCKTSDSCLLFSFFKPDWIVSWFCFFCAKDVYPGSLNIESPPSQPWPHFATLSAGMKYEARAT